MTNEVKENLNLEINQKMIENPLETFLNTSLAVITKDEDNFVPLSYFNTWFNNWCTLRGHQYKFSSNELIEIMSTRGVKCRMENRKWHPQMSTIGKITSMYHVNHPQNDKEQLNLNKIDTDQWQQKNEIFLYGILMNENNTILQSCQQTIKTKEKETETKEVKEVKRWFVAIEIPDDIKNHFYSKYKESVFDVPNSQHAINFTNPDNMHITLSFIGDMSSNEVIIIKQLELIKWNKFPLQLKHVNAFKSFDGKYKSLHLKVAEDYKLALTELAEKICTEINHKVGTRIVFKNAHITIGYMNNVKYTPEQMKKMEKIIETLSTYESSIFNIDRFYLYSSTSQSWPLPPIYMKQSQYNSV